MPPCLNLNWTSISNLNSDMEEGVTECLSFQFEKLGKSSDIMCCSMTIEACLGFSKEGRVVGVGRIGADQGLAELVLFKSHESLNEGRDKTGYKRRV